MENLTYEADIIQSMFPEVKGSGTADSWLLQNIHRFKNTVVLFAGRPDFPTYDNLLRFHAYPSGEIEQIQLLQLSRHETRHYLNKVLKDSPRSLRHLRAQVDHIWEITRGNPVLISLIVEFAYQFAENIPIDAIEHYDAQILGEELSSLFFGQDQNERNPHFFLGLARKGVDANLLHYLQPGWDPIQCEETLSQVQVLSVVKVRQDRGNIFLHDVLYEWFDICFADDASLCDWYGRLKDYYLTKQVSLGLERDKWRENTVHLLYYSLKNNALAAFNEIYIVYSEQAIKAYELGLDILLRDELTRFFREPANQQQAESDGLTEDQVQQYGVIRWIKRLLTLAEYQLAKEIAEVMLMFAPNTLKVQGLKSAIKPRILPQPLMEKVQTVFFAAPDFFWGHLLTYYGETLVYIEPSLIGADILDQAIDLLRTAQDSSWLYYRVLGRAYNTLGYSYRAKGDYKASVEAYEKALNHFEMVGIPDEEADTLNNLAFVMALVGDISKANQHIEKAVRIRRELNQDYTLALSLNTRGLVHALIGNLEIAPQDCLLAREIFEELKASRGLGLVYNALGFIARQKGKDFIERQRFDRAVTSFRGAYEYLTQALDIFLREVEEPVRLWESYNEIGCVYREWGIALQAQNKRTQANEMFRESDTWLRKAWAECSMHPGTDMQFQAVDTADDIMILCYVWGESDQPETWWKHLLTVLPETFKQTLAGQFQSVLPNGNAYWFLIGKALMNREGWKLRHAYWRGESVAGQIAQISDNFALAAACLWYYWGDTSVLRQRYRSIALNLRQHDLPLSTVKVKVTLWAQKHNVDLHVFLNAIEDIYTAR